MRMIMPTTTKSAADRVTDREIEGVEKKAVRRGSGNKYRNPRST